MQNMKVVGESVQARITRILAWLDELENAGYATKLFVVETHLALLFSPLPYKVGVPVLVAEFDRDEPLVDFYLYPHGCKQGRERLAGCLAHKAQPLSLTPNVYALFEFAAGGQSVEPPQVRDGCDTTTR